MDSFKVSQELDGNLPTSLHESVELLQMIRPNAAQASASTTDSHSEETNMNPTATMLTAEQLGQVKAAATQEVARIMGDQNSQAQIAISIEKHMAIATAAQAELAKAQASVADLTKKLELAEAEKKKATEEVTTGKEASKKAEEEHGKKDKAYASQVADLEAKLATAEKKVAEFEGKDKKAKREKAMAEANVKSAKFIERATATDDKGAFKMADDDFDAAVAEFAELNKAVAGEGGGAPIPPPKDNSGPADKQGKGKGTPVPAPTDNKGPADKQKGGKMAHASTETEATATQTTEAAAAPTGEQAATTETTQATAEAVPAQPNLSDVQMFQNATAAMLGGTPTVTKQGKSAYASAFGL